MLSTDQLSSQLPGASVCRNLSAKVIMRVSPVCGKILFILYIVVFLSDEPGRHNGERSEASAPVFGSLEKGKAFG